MRYFKRVSPGAKGKPMSENNPLLDKEDQIKQAMETNRIAVLSVLIRDEIPKDLRKELQIYIADINLIFNPEPNSDQLSLQVFTKFLTDLFPMGKDVKCQTYEDFLGGFVGKCKRNNIASKETVRLFEAALSEIKIHYRFIDSPRSKSPSS